MKLFMEGVPIALWLYIAGAFITVEPNVFKWTKAGRAALVVLIFLTVVMRNIFLSVGEL